MNKRLIRLFDDLGLNKSEIGRAIKVTPQYIWKIYNDGTIPSERIIDSILAAFPHVSEEWLRTGKGDMYVKKTEEEEIADLVAKFFEDSDPRKRDVVKWFLELDEDELKMLEAFARALLGKE